MRPSVVPLALAAVLALLQAPRTGRGLPAAGSYVSDDGTAPARVGPATPSDPVPAARRPFPFVSPARMLESLAALCAIGTDGLFRTSGSSGEREAFDWLAARLDELPFLREIGASIERQEFRIPLSTEVRQASLTLTLAGRETRVPAHALQGHREDLGLALRYDSDGRPGDADPDPVTVEGPPVFVRAAGDVLGTAAGAFRGRVAFVDYAVVDRGIVAPATATAVATELLAREPAALVLVTRYSNLPGVSHGSFAGDVSVLVGIASPASPPTLVVRLEDLAGAGVSSWDDLERVVGARVVWDADVTSPGASQLLALRIPGLDASRAVVVGAHLDSPNSPGALDDGSGAVALLEAARVLDERRIRPPVETWLVFFGSHERGLYGSSVFVTSHGGLLRRAVAMVQLDCLTHPLDGMRGGLVLETQSYAALGDGRLLLPETLQRVAAREGVALYLLDTQGLVSDNSSFAGLGVPHTDTIFLAETMTEVHVDGHLHDPYDDLPLAALHRDQLADLATVAVCAVRDLPLEPGPLAVTPPPTRRALFVASHTEAVQMTPAQQTLLGMALAMEGLGVEVVPYGTPVTDADLSGAAVVFVLPAIDYAADGSGPGAYDEAFGPDEVAALSRYAEGGGLLVVVASATRLRYGTTPLDANEDWAEANVVGAPFGVAFGERRLAGTWATPSSSHPLVSGLSGLLLASGNGLAVRATRGQVLARAGADAAAVLVPVGPLGGEVLALGDAAILGGQSPSTPNLVFFRNLARHARTRPSSQASAWRTPFARAGPSPASSGWPTPGAATGRSAAGPRLQ